MVRMMSGSFANAAKMIFPKTPATRKVVSADASSFALVRMTDVTPVQVSRQWLQL